MTFVFHTMPLLQVKDRSPQKKKRKTGRPAKYDHWAMIQDRLSGMNWSDIAQKHNIFGDQRGSDAFALCMNSSVIKKLTPKEIERLDGIGWRRRCK